MKAPVCIRSGTGKVGINRTTPERELDVEGTARAFDVEAERIYAGAVNLSKGWSMVVNPNGDELLFRHKLRTVATLSDKGVFRAKPR